MDLLLRGSEIIKSQDKKCIFIIYSTFFESVGISPLETCGRLRGEKGVNGFRERTAGVSQMKERRQVKRR